MKLLMKVFIAVLVLHVIYNFSRATLHTLNKLKLAFEWKSYCTLCT